MPLRRVFGVIDGSQLATQRDMADHTRPRPRSTCRCSWSRSTDRRCSCGCMWDTREKRIRKINLFKLDVAHVLLGNDELVWFTLCSLRWKSKTNKNLNTIFITARNQESSGIAISHVFIGSLWHDGSLAGEQNRMSTRILPWSGPPLLLLAVRDSVILLVWDVLN